MPARLEEKTESEQSAASVRSDFVVGHQKHLAGERLAAGLAADQLRRKEREEILAQCLEKADEQLQMAQTMCIYCGFLDLVLLTLFAVSRLAWNNGFGYALGLLGLALMSVLTLSGALAVNSWETRRRLLSEARRNAVEVPVRIPAPSALTSDTVPADSEGARRTRDLQREVNSAYRDEVTLGEICLWAGLAGFASWPLLIVGIVLIIMFRSNGALELWLFILPWSGIVIGLPFPACTLAFRRLRRKRLLQEAAREGLAVRDPVLLACD